jgi:hypothetical protein
MKRRDGDGIEPRQGAPKLVQQACLSDLGGHFKLYHPWPLQTVPVRARVIWEEFF